MESPLKSGSSNEKTLDFLIAEAKRLRMNNRTFSPQFANGAKNAV